MKMLQIQLILYLELEDIVSFTKEEIKYTSLILMDKFYNIHKKYFII